MELFARDKYRSEVKFSNVPGGILRMLCDDKSSLVMFAGNIFFKIVKSCTLHRIVSAQVHCLGQSNAKQEDIHATNTSKEARPTFILRVFSLASCDRCPK